MFKEEGREVPSVMRDRHWEELVKLTTRSARLKYYKYVVSCKVGCSQETRQLTVRATHSRRFVFKIEMKQKGEKRKQAEKAVIYNQMKAERALLPKVLATADPHRYGLGANSIMLRVGDTKITNEVNRQDATPQSQIKVRKKKVKEKKSHLHQELVSTERRKSGGPLSGLMVTEN